MYSPLESLIGHYRGEQDSMNSVAAATLTGVIYKSTGSVNFSFIQCCVLAQSTSLPLPLLAGVHAMCTVM